jgi:hypothetical protein
MPHSIAHWMRLWFRFENLGYLAQSYLPFLPLIWAAGKRYALLPLPLVLFYMGFPDPSYRDIWRHYGLAVGITALGTLILADREKVARAAAPFLLAVLLAFPGWRGLQRMEWNPHPARGEIAALAKELPPDSSLLVHGQFVAHFAGRRDVESWIYSPRPPQSFRFLVLDSAFRPEWWEGKNSLDSVLAVLQADPDWEMLRRSRGIYLFRRSPP